MTTQQNVLRVASYNLFNHRGIKDVARLQPLADIICLQECDTKMLPDVLGDLKLAGSTLTNRQGLAIYYNPDHVELADIEAFALKKSLHDRVMKPTDERLLVACFRTNDGRLFQVGCFHAAPLTASNALRRKQITTAQQLLRSAHDGAPSLLVGDYNYPLFRRRLKRMSTKNGFDLALSDRPTYALVKVLKGHFDFLTLNGMSVLTVNTLPHGKSDHAPIVAHVQLKDEINEKPEVKVIAPPLPDLSDI